MKSPYTSKETALSLGKEICKRRKSAHLKQKDLADLLGMTTSQLCKIEKGANTPTPRTLSRIEASLGLSGKELTGLLNQMTGETGHYWESMYDITYDYRKAPHIPEHLPSAQCPYSDDKTIQKYLDNEDVLGLVHFCRLNALSYAISTTADAVSLADKVRRELDCGDSPFPVLLPKLAQQNVRIIASDSLPRYRVGKNRIKLHAFLIYDLKNDFPIITIDKNDSPEEQLYGIAFELGRHLCFRKSRYWKSFAENRRPSCWSANDFCRAFADEITMPATKLRNLASDLHVASDQWTNPLLGKIANVLTVSHKRLLSRLNNLSLIDPATREKLKAEPYKAISRTPPLQLETWLELLTERAKIA